MRPPLTTPTRRSAIGAALAAGGAWPGAAAAQSLRDLVEPPARFAWEFAGGARSTGWLALEPDDAALVAPGRVNGAPVRLLIDSGAGACVLDVATARRLGLRAVAAQKVTDGVGRALPGAELAGVDVTLGALRLRNLRTLALDLPGALEPGRLPLMVLGREAFEALLVEIDAPAGRIAFYAPGAAGPPAGARPLPLTRASEDTRALPVAAERVADASAQFDTGSQEALTASEAFAAAHGWLSGRPTSTWIAGSVAGVSPERTATVRGLTVAGWTLPPAPTGMVAAWERPRTPLILGLPTLGRFRLLTDYRADKLWLLPDPARLAEPYAKDRSGLACQPTGTTLEVLFVAAGSPAAQGGWRVGERIARIDGAPAASARGFGDGAPGRTYALTLGTGEVRRLTLADYF